MWKNCSLFNQFQGPNSLVFKQGCVLWKVFLHARLTIHYTGRLQNRVNEQWKETKKKPFSVSQNVCLHYNQDTWVALE